MNIVMALIKRLVSGDEVIPSRKPNVDLSSILNSLFNDYCRRNYQHAMEILPDYVLSTFYNVTPQLHVQYIVSAYYLKTKEEFPRLI